jgi:hypothetical protein
MEAATFLWESHSKYEALELFDTSRKPPVIKRENTIAEYKEQG